MYRDGSFVAEGDAGEAWAFVLQAPQQLEKPPLNLVGKRVAWADDPSSVLWCWPGKDLEGAGSPPLLPSRELPALPASAASHQSEPTLQALQYLLRVMLATVLLMRMTPRRRST